MVMFRRWDLGCGVKFQVSPNSVPAFALDLDSETMHVRPLVCKKGMGLAPVILAKQLDLDDKCIKNYYSQSVGFFLITGNFGVLWGKVANFMYL